MRAIPSVSITLLAVLALACCTGGGGTSSTTGSGGGTTGRATTGGHSSGSNGGSSSGGAAGGGLGSGCGNPNPCASPLSCLSQIPQGYCTEECNPAACPSNGTCVEALTQFLCGLSCATDADCTRGGYACDPTCLVCVPTELTGQLSCPPSYAGNGGHGGGGAACGTLPTAAGGLTWSSSVNASEGQAASNEFEGSGAAAPGDAGIVVVAYMETGDAGQTNVIGISASNDDGLMFTAVPPITNTTTPDLDTDVYDPSLAVDPFGLFYLSWGGYYETANAQGQGHIWVTTSHDGVTWLTAQSILGPGDIPYPGDGGGGVDKPAIGVNPDGFLPYVVMGTFNGTYGEAGPYQIRLIVGGQGGQAWQSSVDVDDSIATHRAAWRDLPAIDFDSAGNAYVAWVETQNVQQIAEDQITGTAITGTTAASVWFAVVQPPLGGQVLPGETNVRVSLDTDIVVLDVPKIVAAPSGDQLYVVYTVGTGANNVTNIEVATSTVPNLGSTWSQPVVVNKGLSDAADCSTNFHASAFLDSQNDFWVTWVSNIDGNGSVLYSESVDQGLTFSAPAVVSDVPFAFNTQLAIPATLGGYQSLFGGNGELFSLWTGAPNSTSPSSPSLLFLQKAQ